MPIIINFLNNSRLSDFMIDRRQKWVKGLRDFSVGDVCNAAIYCAEMYKSEYNGSVDPSIIDGHIRKAKKLIEKAGNQTVSTIDKTYASDLSDLLTQVTKVRQLMPPYTNQDMQTETYACYSAPDNFCKMLQASKRR
jgi:hypothetical protein